MKLGAEPKKIWALGSLLFVAVLVLYFNVFSGSSHDSPPPLVSRPAGNSTPASAAVNTAPRAGKRAASIASAGGEFVPRVGQKRGEAAPDPSTVDPTLRLDLLAKIQNVQPEAALRNLFQFGAAQQAAAPVKLPANVPKIDLHPKPTVAQNMPPPGPPPPPPPPPITFKYYGFKVSKVSGQKQAFLLDGEDIILAKENDLVKRRYKIVKIGLNSITVEDTQFKNTQTLPLHEEAAA